MCLWRVQRHATLIVCTGSLVNHACVRLSSATIAGVIIEQGMKLDRRRTSAACKVSLHSNATCPLHRHGWHSHALHLSASIPYHGRPRIRILQTAKAIMDVHSCCHAEHHHAWQIRQRRCCSSKRRLQRKRVNSEQRWGQDWLVACRQRTFPTVQFPCVYERAPVPVMTPAMLVEPARDDTRLSIDLG